MENSDPGLVVGSKVSATDDDHLLPLIYQLHGPDANSFDLQASTGQIRTKRGVVYDSETKPMLNVTMTVSDRQGGTDAIAVMINVTNVPEAPSTPDRPTVRATPGSSRSLDVSWKAPDNTGPAITGYNIRYREGNSGGFTLIPPAGTGTTATLRLLCPRMAIRSRPAPPTRCTCGPRTAKAPASGRRRALGERASATASRHSMTGPA